MTSFEQLMNICKSAAHDRNACTEGYAQLLRAENIPQILHVWRQNWDDVYRSRYYDIMAKNIVGVFDQSKDLFHASEVFVNEPAEKGLLIIASPTQPIEVTGSARAYLFTAAEVTARGWKVRGRHSSRLRLLGGQRHVRGVPHLQCRAGGHQRRTAH